VHGRHPTGETARRLIDTRACSSGADFARACTLRDGPRVTCRRRNEPEAFLYAFDLLELASVGLIRVRPAEGVLSPRPQGRRRPCSLGRYRGLFRSCQVAPKVAALSRGRGTKTLRSRLGATAGRHSRQPSAL
jgi:hypothetical protein